MASEWLASTSKYLATIIREEGSNSDREKETMYSVMHQYAVEALVELAVNKEVHCNCWRKTVLHCYLPHSSAS